jgi:hypothetical protein
MATCLTTWTVLPHEPLEKLSDNLWRLEGRLESGTRRIMTLARLGDGRILMHNAIALEDPLMAEIDAWGEVAGILVPNAFHRMDCRIMQERYPKAKVYAPAGAIKAVQKATSVHGSFAEVPQDAHVQVRHLSGIKEREGVMEVQTAQGLAVVFNDMLMNMPKLNFPIELFIGPSGQLSIPRFARWFFTSDKKALRGDLEGILARQPMRLIPGHGKDVVDDIPTHLQGAIGLL